jgi:hypothetical protein
VHLSHRKEAAVFTITCPACQAQLHLSPRRILVRVDAESSTSGEALFTCLSCGRTSTVSLDASGVAALVLAGVTHLSLSTPVVEPLEDRPDGPHFTADDVIDWHAQLAGSAWLDELVDPQDLGR